MPLDVSALLRSGLVLKLTNTFFSISASFHLSSCINRTVILLIHLSKKGSQPYLILLLMVTDSAITVQDVWN